MSLRYLDINLTPISEEGIYNKIVNASPDPDEPGEVEYKFVEKQIDAYLNGVFGASMPCNTCSSGYNYAGYLNGLYFYNNNLKIYTSFDLINGPEIDTAYKLDKEILYIVSPDSDTITTMYFTAFPSDIEYFSSTEYGKNGFGIKYIGKKNGKIGIFINSASTGQTFTEYTGEKLIGLEGKNISFFKDGETDIYAIFCVGTNLYRYNYQDDFIDDNIILWGILPESIENFSLGARIDATFNIQEFYLIDFVEHKYYTATFTDTPPTPAPTTFKGTINFADGDTTEQTFDYEIGYVETQYLYSDNCTFKFYDTSNALKTTIQHANTDSYKYAETITINEEQYPINSKQQVSLSSDFTIQVNNGVVAFYNVNFKQDATILQTERLQEETIPTYKGATPVKDGYVFSGWTPTPYPVDKQQDYIASFELEPFTLTIADSGSNNFSVVWFDTQSSEKTREFSTPITSIRVNQLFEPYPNVLSLIIGYGDSESSICMISYEENNVIPQNFKIGDTTYNFGTDYSVSIDSDTTINIVAKTRYFIRFLNYDDSVLETKYVYAGETPTYTGDTPYQKGYDFTGWTPALYPADKSQDYKATFTIQTFTIRFLNDDGSVLETKSVNYGTTPTYTGETPTKEGYTFNGWSPVLYPANKNQDYTATYRNNAFAVTLYKNTAENNRIDKTDYLTSVGEITGYLRHETNIINPSILIEYTGVIDFNYVYISTFNRYYFVNNITSVRTNLWRLDMSCDVLMTYKDTILNYECYVSRNENDYNPDIEDTYLPLEYEKVVEVTNLSNDTYGKIFLESKYSIVFTTIYEGTEYQVIDEQVETAFQDLNGDILEVPSISLGASNYRCIGIITNNILANLNKLVEKTINDDTLASYVISLIAFPIDSTYLSLGKNILNPEKLLIKDDVTSIPITQGDVDYPKGGVLSAIDVIQFTIQPKYNNFLDYEPYTTYEIYLPFYGWLKLNSYQILNEQLVVTYYPQVDSEQCSITISKGAIIGRSKEVIAEVTCQLGIQIPINSTNVERINREKTANTLNSIVGTISGAAIGVGGAVTGNPLAAVGGVSMAIGSITSGLSKNMTMLPSAQSKTGSSYDGAMGDRVFKLRVTYPKIAVDDMTKYAKYIGRPLQTNVKLNTLSGYTIVGGVHIENLATATDNEKTDIENQLRKGVII